MMKSRDEEAEVGWLTWARPLPPARRSALRARSMGEEAEDAEAEAVRCGAYADKKLVNILLTRPNIHTNICMQPTREEERAAGEEAGSGCETKRPCPRLLRKGPTSRHGGEGASGRTGLDTTAGGLWCSKTRCRRKSQGLWARPLSLCLCLSGYWGHWI